MKSILYGNLGKSLQIAAAAVAACAVTLADVPTARACGCLAPPVPDPVNDDTFAVNQQAEQIIFETRDGTTTAHILIRYAGDPAQFAWILPVPVVPDDLALSESVAFGLIDDASAPTVSVGRESLCPSPEYVCTQHPPPTGCTTPPGYGAVGGAGGTGGLSGGDFGSGGAAGMAGMGGGEPPVTVFDRQQIGGYDTVTFGAGDAQAAVDWLNAEGFIVNATMTPFLQQYVDANMVFVAAKLVPGADLDAIRPLGVTYAGAPMIPLILTAVAAEPHMTVTSYIFADEPYEPESRPLLGLDPRWISTGADGRVNYPMVVARAADDAGGDGFVMEYQGTPPPSSLDANGCCGSDFDQCFAGDDGVCQCPGDAFDAADCADDEDLVNGVQLYRRLQDEYPVVTRLTTRLSAEEMTFDPMFQPMTGEPPVEGRLRLSNDRQSLESCRDDVVDEARYQSIETIQQCAALYCSDGECASAESGEVGCVCETGFVARKFTDLDGQESVTCVPDQAPVDFASAGITLPDACKNVDCGAGRCVDVGGFPTCRCTAGNVAVLGAEGRTATCKPVDLRSGFRGARDFSTALVDVRVCAPAPTADCGRWGWLVPNQNKERQGVVCTSSIPEDPTRFEVPPEPTCEEYYGPGYGGSGGSGGSDPFDPRNPNDPSVPLPGSSGGAGGTAGASSDAGAAGADADDVAATGGGGCSVSSTRATAWGTLPLLLGAGLLGARRRRRKRPV